MNTFFIYGLYDPAEPLVFRYVGLAASLHKRLITHRTQLQPWNGVPAQWKWSVGLFRRKFQMAIIDAVRGDKGVALAAEQHHIRRLHSSHRLENASSHRHRNADVPALVYAAYLRNIVALQGMATATGPHILQAVRFIAGTLVDIEESYPSMRLCTANDCYFDAAEKFWENPNQAVDSRAVSR